MNIPYNLIRSKRKTLSIQIDRSGKLIVRSPIKLSIHLIEEFINAKHHWIKKHQIKRENIPIRPILEKNEITLQKKKLESHIIPRVYELWK